MPDPEMKTVSASEAAALFNASPYCTRWMLYQKFKHGLDISAPESSRMKWGKAMQPLILQQVARDKKLEVIPNESDSYARRGLLGCTRDSVIICPDRGPGALEIKTCFDYEVWATKYRGGSHIPREIEIQLQTQMFVGDEERQRSFEWGMTAVWVCADLHYFERRPVLGLWNRLQRDAEVFFHQVENGLEPEPFGAAVEAPFLTALFPTRPESVLDLSNDPDHVKTSADVSMYQDFKESKNGAERVVEQQRVKLLALAKDYEFVKLPCGVGYRVQKSGKGKTVVPFVPDVLLPPPPPKDLPNLAAG